MKGAGLDAYSSRLALGSIWLLGAFLLVAAFRNFAPFFEATVQQSSWAVLVALPTLVLSYALGSGVIHTTSLMTVPLEERRREIRDGLAIDARSHGLISGRYETLRNELEFLRGAVPTLVFLAVSVTVAALRLLYGARLAETLAATLIGAAALTGLIPLVLILTVRVRREMQLIVEESARTAGEPQS